MRGERPEGIHATPLCRVVAGEIAQTIEVRDGILHRGEIQLEELALASEEIPATRAFHLMKGATRDADLVEQSAAEQIHHPRRADEPAIVGADAVLAGGSEACITPLITTLEGLVNSLPTNM